MGIVCRPILLHNEFLPARTGKRTWDYQMFGHYDGMTCGKSFYLNDGSSFEQLFEVCAEYDSTIHPYFTQILFGLHPEEEKEEAFWKKETPFFYMTLLQFSDKKVKKYREYLESRQYLEREYQILGLCGAAEDTTVIAYHSFANSDLLLLMKCKKAEAGARIINNLHQNVGGLHPFQLKNSYSILGVRKKDINKKGPFLEEDEPIDTVELRIVERTSNSIGGLYCLLKEKLEAQIPGVRLERKAMLGTEDEAIIIKKLSWNALAPFYREKEGILCNSNACTQIYANAISAKIMIPLDELKGEGGGTEPEPRYLLCDLIYNKIEGIYKNRKDEQGCAERKNLILLVNALCRFEYAYRTGSAFSDYNFFSMLLPFYMFTELMAEQKRNTAEYYYDFMKSMKLRTQNFAKPDRVYSQITDFNMRYFDVPAKFVTLYSAYVYYMKNALDVEKEKKYEFLVCPGVSSKVGVGELFRRWNKINRLFLIEIPERQVYNLKLMFIILGHETAHFVGTDVRQREERLDSVLKISSRIILISMRNYLAAGEKFHLEGMEEQYWDNLGQKLSEWIEFYVEKNLDEDFLRNYHYKESIGSEVVKENLEFNKDYYRHTDVLKRILTTAVDDMLLERGTDIFSFVIREEFEQEVGHIGYDNQESYYREKRELLRSCIYDFVARRGQQDKSLTFGNAVKEMNYLLKECYADIICILSLRLPLKDYIYTFVMSVEASGKEISILEDTIVIARIAIVMEVMSYPLQQLEGKGFQWTNSEFEEHGEEDQKIIALEEMANSFVYNYINRRSEISPEKMTDSAVQVVYDGEITKEVIRYLLNCRIKFSDAESAAESGKDMAKARQIYALTGESDADIFFDKMMCLLYDYERDIYKDIEKLVEEKQNDERRDESYFSEG